MKCALFLVALAVSATGCVEEKKPPQPSYDEYQEMKWEIARLKDAERRREEEARYQENVREAARQKVLDNPVVKEAQKPIPPKRQADAVADSPVHDQVDELRAGLAKRQEAALQILESMATNIDLIRGEGTFTPPAEKVKDATKELRTAIVDLGSGLKDARKRCTEIVDSVPRALRGYEAAAKEHEDRVKEYKLTDLGQPNTEYARILREIKDRLPETEQKLTAFLAGLDKFEPVMREMTNALSDFEGFMRLVEHSPRSTEFVEIYVARAKLLGATVEGLRQSVELLIEDMKATSMSKSISDRRKADEAAKKAAAETVVKAEATQPVAAATPEPATPREPVYYATSAPYVPAARPTVVATYRPVPPPRVVVVRTVRVRCR